MDTLALDVAVRALRRGGIIAYPTEAVYGLGCDPANEAAVARLLSIKRRSAGGGLVLVAADIAQLGEWLAMDRLPRKVQQTIRDSWPGPCTWVMPASAAAPRAVCAGDGTLAVRVSAHPLVGALCTAFAGPLVSTSANRHGAEPLCSARSVSRLFGDTVDVVLDGALGDARSPCPIVDALSGRVIRAAGADQADPA